MSTLPDHEAPSQEDGIWGARIESLRPALMCYVMSLLPDRDACDDVVQETCLFLWNRRGEFEQGTNFKAWAFKAVWFKVLTHKREAQRSRLINFSEDVLERISKAAEQLTEDVDHRLAELPSDNQRLLQLKYLNRVSLTDHAKSLGLRQAFIPFLGRC